MGNIFSCFSPQFFLLFFSLFLVRIYFFLFRIDEAQSGTFHFTPTRKKHMLLASVFFILKKVIFLLITSQKLTGQEEGAGVAKTWQKT